MQVLMNLSQIDPNPYQPREREDPEHVKKIALSIAAQGLLQVPVGRRVGDRVQLAFGHTRLAAYQWLLAVQPNSDLAGDWAQMPVELRELTDLEMFEQGITENLARKDLTPIEEARAMRRYKDDFGKTSVEIGSLFGLSDSAVRNKMRLLDLPDETRVLLDQGGISEGTARKLLTLQKVAPTRVNEVAGALANNGFKSPDEISAMITRQIRDEANINKQLYEMWDATWKSTDEEPRGGSGLWPLTWAPTVLPALKFTDVQKLYDEPKEFVFAPPDEIGVKFTLKDVFLAATRTDWDWRGTHEKHVEGAESFFELLDQLIRPPACTACSLHSAIDGKHYCALKTCWQRKRQAWYQAELDRLSEELGIQTYDPVRDGKDFEEAGRWDASREQYQKWLAKKAGHLRLRIKYQEYSVFAYTDSNCVQLISVRPEVAKHKQAEREEDAQRDESRQAQSKAWELENQNRRQSWAFIERVASVVFAPAFAPLGIGVLEGMTVAMNDDLQDLPVSGIRRKEALQCRVAHRELRILVNWSQLKDGPIAVADHLEGVAKAWGVKLPDDWMDQAHDFAGEAEKAEPASEMAML